MEPVRRFVRFVATTVALASVGSLSFAAHGAAAPLAIQARAAEAPLALHAYTLRYQQAIEAIPLIQPLLSNRGTLELQPGGNTVVIRDTGAALARILPVLRSFDHPAQPIKVDIMIVRASRSVVSPPAPHSDLPEGLTRRLSELLHFDSYELQAQADLASQEGQAVVYNLGEDFEVSFRVGTLLEARTIKLSNFEVSRRAASPSRRPALPLVHTSLNLCLDQTMSLGLARSEASRDALIIVVTAHHGDPRPHPE